MSNIILDVDSVVGEDTALIVLAETGICYTAQTNGVACDHPVAEGFVLNLGSMFKDFDDCALLCAVWKGNDAERQQTAAKQIDALVRRVTEALMFRLEFDCARIEELTEGWWPVRVTGRFWGMYLNEEAVLDHQAFIFIGSCD